MKKRIPVLLLSLVMCLSFLPTGVFAAGEQDMPSDWSKEAMEAAVENGLLHGDDLGNLNPKGLLTRAQMAAVITRAFGAVKQADLSAYADMDSSKWYYEAVSQAAFMGIMGGDGQYMNPDSDITRQEAFTVLARAMKLPAGDPAVLKSFHDADAVADWAAGSMAAMVAAGYVGGSDGMLNPVGSITREEFAQVMFNIFGTYYTQAGTYTEAPVRSVMVNVPDVILKNVKVHGDIIVGDGVGDGDVTLDHVALEGRLVVRGGGVNSVHIIGDEQTWQVVIAKVDGNVRVVTEGTGKIETLTVEDGADDIIIEGNVATVNVETEGVTVKLNNAKVDKLNVVAANTAVTMSGKTEVNYLSVSEGAKGTKVEAEKTVTISNVLADTDLTLVGEAKVEKIEGSGAVTDESGEAVKETPDQTPVYVPPYTPPAHTHTWVDGAILTPATCTAEGKKVQTCTCGQTQEVTIPMLPHTEEELPAVAATCTVGGLTAGKRCTVCQTVTQAQEPVDALGHDWGEGEVTTEATCAATGTKTFTCSRCQETRTEAIPMIEHTWVAGESVENETCGGSTTTSTCSVCGATKTESTGEATHTPAEAVRENEIPATCAAGGSYDEVVKCSACQAELSREHKTTEKTTEHTEVIDPAVEPTCTGTGKTAGKHCSVCNEVIVAQTILPAAGHTFAEEWSSDETDHWHAATCEHTDEAKDKAAHNWNAGEVTTEPTCETAGVKTFTCTVCEATKTEAIEALGHDPAAEWTSDDTSHWHTCSRCDEKLDNAAHTEVIDPAVEPTCGTAGKTEGKHCSVCGKILVAQEPISATENHTYGDWTSVDANSHKRTCSVCGKVETGAHSFGEDNTCDICGYVKPSTPGTQVPASAGIEKIEASSNCFVVTAFKPTDATGIRSFQIYLYDSQHESDSGFWFDRDPSGSDPNWNVFNIYVDSFRDGYHYDKVRLTCWPKDGYEKAEWNGDLTVNTSSMEFPSCTAETDSRQQEDSNGTYLWVNLRFGQAISGFFAFNFYNSDTDDKLGTSYNTNSTAKATASAFPDASDGFDIANMISLVNAGKLQIQVQWFAPPEVVSIREVNLKIANSEKMTVAPTTTPETPPTPEVPEGLCFYMDHGSPRLKWDAPTDVALNEGEKLRYNVYLKKSGTTDWVYETSTSQTFLTWPTDKAGTYQVKVEVLAENTSTWEEQSLMTYTGDLTLTVTGATGSQVAPPTYEKNDALTEEWEMEVYDVAFTGLASNTFFEFCLRQYDAEGHDHASSHGSVSKSDGTAVQSQGGDDVLANLTNGEYLVLEYSNPVVSEDGKTCSYTVTQRGDWAPCTPSSES